VRQAACHLAPGCVALGLQSYWDVAGINNGQNFVDLTVTFTPQIDLFLIEVEPVTLTYTRRAFRPS
jgi:hypothetical protein